MHMPFPFATQDDRDEGKYSPWDAELLYRKNRNGAMGIAPFEFHPQQMKINDPSY